MLNSSQWRNTSGWGCLGRLPIRESTLNLRHRRDQLLERCRQRLDAFREQRGEEVFVHLSAS